MADRNLDPAESRRFALRFTPAQWRSLLEDDDFLRDADNSYAPRRLMGVPVEIVPDPAYPWAPARRGGIAA